MCMRVKTIDELTQFSIQRKHPAVRTHADTVLEWMPTGLALASALVRKKKDTILRETLVYFLSLGLQKAAVLSLKRLTHHVRPNFSFKQNSFPSGHAATAFMGAAALALELEDKPLWATLAGYTPALGVCALRMYKNKHWLSDVVSGAAIGFVSVKLATLLINRLAKERKKHTFRPAHLT